MDSMPVEVVGLILSHVASARHVARASATCRKWRDAAKHHCLRLSFTISDLEQEEKQDMAMFRSERMVERMVIVTEAVLQRTCLCELLISDVEVHEAPLIACLVHTQRTLKSLTLERSLLRVNILEKLAFGKVALECLVCQFAYIPKLNPVIHSLPSLVSLTLRGKANGLHGVKDIQVLLSLFPKLEFLSLQILELKASSAAEDELHIPPSLKTLHLEVIFSLQSDSTHFVLHADNLKSLSLDTVGAYRMTIFGHHLECLDIDDILCKGLEVGILPSLLDLKLYYLPEDLAMQVLCKASTKLNKLVLQGYDQYTSIKCAIASLFPCLRQLSLFLPKFSHSSSSRFEQVVALKLFAYFMNSEEVDEIAKFMFSFPNLKQLTLEIEAFPTHITARHLNHLMQLYPHLDIRTETLHFKSCQA